MCICWFVFHIWSLGQRNIINSLVPKRQFCQWYTSLISSTQQLCAGTLLQELEADTLMEDGARLWGKGIPDWKGPKWKWLLSKISPGFSSSKWSDQLCIKERNANGKEQSQMPYRKEGERERKLGSLSLVNLWKVYLQMVEKPIQTKHKEYLLLKKTQVLAECGDIPV